MSEIILPRPLEGTVSAPGSKSRAHRLLICAALSKSPSRIVCGNMCDDVMSTKCCLEALGARFDGDMIYPIDRSSLPDFPVMDCGESGSTLRFLLPVCGALGINAVFRMAGRLPQRPLYPLDDVLCRHGMSIEKRGNELVCGGKLRSGLYEIAGNVSSQFVSGLLMALPLLERDSLIRVTGKTESAPYIIMTEQALTQAGIGFEHRENQYLVFGEQQYDLPDCTVEGDWSAAAFFICMGAFSEKGVSVANLPEASLQGDRKLLDILRRMGADVCAGGGEVKVKKDKLHGAEIDASDIPDLIPALAVVCAGAKGESRIYNAHRLRYKESDRLRSIYVMLTSLGADITELPDGLIIRGGGRLRGGAVSSFGDHRIAMAIASASLICDGEIEIDDIDCVKKSYPDFLRDFISLGGEISEHIQRK